MWGLLVVTNYHNICDCLETHLVAIVTYGAGVDCFDCMVCMNVITGNE